MDACKGRFAPSPTGRMHLGNIFTALISWLDAKSRGGTWLLRIEDLDTQRSRYEYARLIEDDLSWLGLEWDEGGLDDTGDAAPYSQSRRSGIYAGCLSRLEATGFTYPCRCTRAGIMAARAPHQRDGRVIYGGTCRPGRAMPPGLIIPTPCGSMCLTPISYLPTACAAASISTLRASAAISYCAVPTEPGPTSWPSL